MPISLLSYAQADIQTAESALDAVKAGKGNSKALKGIIVPKEITANANKYSDWEAAGRYDLHFSVRVDSVEKAVRLSTEWMKEIKKK